MNVPDGRVAVISKENSERIERISKVFFRTPFFFIAIAGCIIILLLFAILAVGVIF